MSDAVNSSATSKSRNDYDKDKEKPVIAKSATDLQRLRLEKLMKQPDKPVPIPERPKEKSMPHVPDFVRNVMGSSAGAGSGEFHVYRHLRRKEYARQKFIQEKADRDTRDDDYQKKLEDNRKAAEERTAKKRAKRLKKKQKQQKRRKNSGAVEKSDRTAESSESEGDDSDASDDEKEKEK